MPRALAINVGANTNEPGFRGPIYPDGRFEFVPIPESEPTREPVPTYADLGLPIDVPSDAADRPVHLDPEFGEYAHCTAYTYGDPHPAKAGPIGELTAGDWLLFYATLSTADGAGSAPETAGEVAPGADSTGGTTAADWIAPDWGAYLIGEFRVDEVVVADPDAATDVRATALSPADRERFASNAHLKRERFDARVLVRGTPGDSRLYDRAVPLSTPQAGADANRVVTDLSADSGKGPWWRRPLRFDPAATADLRTIVEHRAIERSTSDPRAENTATERWDL